MRTLYALIALCMTSSATAQIDKKIRLKMYGNDSADISSTITAKLSNFNMSLGYGALVGKSFLNPKSQFGVIGSGYLNSEFYNNRLGAQYLPTDMNWGKNGLNVAMDGKIGKGFVMGATYQGYNNLAGMNFSGTVGNFTGKGYVLSKDNKVEQLVADAEFKF